MSGNGLNLLSYEKFDDALNIINSLDACNPSEISSTLSKANNLPSNYSGISSGIDIIAGQLTNLGSGSLTDLVSDYKTAYEDLKTAIIDAFIAEYEFALESANVNGVEVVNLGTTNNTLAFINLLSQLKTKNSSSDSSITFSSLEEFFKALDNACDKYSISLDDTTSNLQPKNNKDIAHRGLTKGGLKENSLEAFELAGLSGFWGVETDIRFDSDGNLVCSHNAVSSGENPPTLEEYLDICKKYGMTAILDLKYIDGPQNAEGGELSKAVLDVIEEKGMLDSVVLQTNSAKDIVYIREQSSDARIWCLTDEVTKNMDTIVNNNVECVNLEGKDGASAAAKRLVEAGIEVCVWNVQNETYKNNLTNLGVEYIMTDNILGITQYQDGDVDVNNLNYTTTSSSNVDYSSLLNIFGSDKLNTDVSDLTTLTFSNSYDPTKGITPEVALYAKKGFTYGPQAYETWYDLDMNLVVKNLTNLYGFTNVTTRVREDGVKLVSGTMPDGTTFTDLVMVAADVIASSNPNGTFERGEIVQTSLGTGIVVDMCEEAMNKRKNGGDIHFDIATAWWSSPYISQIYGDNNVLVGYTGSKDTSLTQTYNVDYSSTNKTAGSGTLTEQVVNLNNQTTTTNKSPSTTLKEETTTTTNKTPTTNNDSNAGNSGTTNSGSNNNSGSTNTDGNNNNGSSNSGGSTNSGSNGNSGSSSSNNIPSYEPPKSNTTTTNVVLLSNLNANDLTDSVIYNKLLCDLPTVNNGTIESVNLNSGVLTYDISNVKADDYNSFVEKITSQGYKLTSSGVYSNGSYQINLSHDDANMNITLKNL